MRSIELKVGHDLNCRLRQDAFLTARRGLRCTELA